PLHPPPSPLFPYTTLFRSAQRNVEDVVALSRQLYWRLYLGQAQRLAAVEFAEVNRLSNIRISFAPILADLKNQPGAEFELAFAQDRKSTRLNSSHQIISYA